MLTNVMKLNKSNRNKELQITNNSISINNYHESHVTLSRSTAEWNHAKINK